MAKKQSSFSWAWVFLFLILGLFAAFILFLDQKIVKTSTPTPAAETKKQENDKPRIDFYSILPGRVVDIPVSEEEQQAIENPAINKTADQTVILQVGSFQNVNDADGLKAQLAFLGLEAKIKSAQVNNGTWYRVLLGPYGDNSELSRTKNQLIENSIKFMQRSARP